ncbi:SKI8 subunit of superkiller complex protein-like [Macrosteles quadrilineatus]|uniref:SKI8 subunit of superkiller complex protein-like n=1 Tax=Macrosteles quadrilineatus TaxID=74068 RepID=UPI0023E1C6CA|nr:SKI8 subunit of superkiller complex protein-like [Macrosteles quadrilineatus]
MTALVHKSPSSQLTNSHGCNKQCVVTGAVNGTVKIWKVQENALETLQEIQNADCGSIFSVGVNPQGSHIFAMFTSGSIKMWSTDGVLHGTIQTSPLDHCNGVFIDDSRKIVTGTHDGKINFYYTGNCGLAKSITTTHGFISSVAFSPDSQLLAAGFESGNVVIYRHRSGAIIKDCNLNGKKVNCISFSNDSKEFISCTGIGVTIYGVEQNRLLHFIPAHLQPILSCSLSNNGKFFLTCSEDNSVNVWDKEECVSKATIVAHSDSVWGALYLMCDKKIVTVSEDKTVKMFKLKKTSQSKFVSWAVPIVNFIKRSF